MESTASKKKKNDRVYNEIPYPPDTPLKSSKIWGKSKSKIKSNSKYKTNYNTFRKRRKN